MAVDCQPVADTQAVNYQNYYVLTPKNETGDKSLFAYMNANLEIPSDGAVIAYMNADASAGSSSSSAGSCSCGGGGCVCIA